MRDDLDLTGLKDQLVVAVDGSPSSRAALLFAAELADALNVELHVVQVWNLVIGPWPETEAPLTEVDVQGHADQALTSCVRATLAGRTSVRVVAHALRGNVKPVLTDISQLARQIVVGTRGHGDVVGMLLGSVSEHLVHHAHCPVTVVQPASQR